MNTDFIPFNRPVLAGREMEYISQAIEGGRISGNGEFTQRCEELLETALGGGRALLTTSGTHALEMAAFLVDLQPGDEVIVPSFTFVTSILAFVLRGAVPVFCDIRADTLNLDERLLAELITERTRAVVPVHYGGVACEMDEILALLRGRDCRVVEDAAHGLFATYRGRPLGRIGDLAAFSFHETKNFHCGEGGALLINDPDLVERAEIIREKGTNRSQMFRGEVDKYTWHDLGSSYVISEILAAFLLAQFEKRSSTQAIRRRIWEHYLHHLKDWAETNQVGLPQVPPDREPAYHLFYLLLPDEASRSRLIQHLRDRGIHSVFHYLPLHLSPMGRRLGGEQYHCPVSVELSDRLLRLPFYNSLKERDLLRITEAIGSFTV